MAFDSTVALSDVEAPLLNGNDTVQGSFDFKSQPVLRSKSGGWNSAFFILGVEVAERFAYYGIASNLISYLTGPLGQSTASAAASVNAWTGTASLLPLLGAFLADSCFGRYWMIIGSSILYILGLGLLSLSALVFANGSSDCQNGQSSSSCSPPRLQIILFFIALYVTAFAQGGHRPCVQAFGADQFDDLDTKELKAKSSFFNWWNFSMSIGTLTGLCILSYIQDNVGWVLGFGVPCIITCLTLILFSLGTFNYRYQILNVGRSPFQRIGQVFVRAVRNWKTTSLTISMEEEAHGVLPRQGSEQFKFLNKALVTPEGSKQDGKVCCIKDIEEAKAVLRLIPIWVTCLGYGVVISQVETVFNKQGASMDRQITSTFKIPAAALLSFITLSVLLFIPIYDRIIVPIARTITGKPSGISKLQRIGTGLFLSFLSMAIAALVEKKRLQTAFAHGLVDLPDVTVPMSAWWVLPQYVVMGISDVFTIIGLQEFFYDQAPAEMKSAGLALYLSILGIGSFLSSFLVSIINNATSGPGRDSWFSNNLNRAHLDYFLWLLAGISAFEFLAFLYFAKSYVYNSKRSA